MGRNSYLNFSLRKTPRCSLLYFNHFSITCLTNSFGREFLFPRNANKHEFSRTNMSTDISTASSRKSAVVKGHKLTQNTNAMKKWASQQRSLISHSFQHSFFPKTGRFPWVSGGFLERRIPGKNGEGTPRTLRRGEQACQQKLTATQRKDVACVPTRALHSVFVLNIGSFRLLHF